MTAISIIIPVWNGRHLLPPCLESLHHQQLRDGSPPEIIAVDNGSADGSAEWIAVNAPHVRLLRHRYNLGWCGGCNRGLRAAQANILVLLNQDTEVYPAWLQALERAFDDSGVGIAGCKIYYPDGETIQHAGGWTEWPLGYGHHWGYRALDAGQWDEAKPVEWVTGAAIAIRRTVYAAIGELDEEFWPGYMADIDYCLRAKAQGFETWYIPTAVLQHQESASTNDKVELSRIFNRNQLRFVLKYVPPTRWLQEVAPVEQQLLANSSGKEALYRQMNLLDAAASAASLLLHYWQADQVTIQKVVETLRTIANARSTALRATLGDAAPQHAVMPAPPSLASLTEFEFTSSTPLVGVLFSGFRRLWYNVAARWAILHLRIQQDIINQQQFEYNRQQFEYNRQLQAQLQSLHTYYQQEIEQLQQQLALSIEHSSVLAQQVLTLQHQSEKDSA
jgi:GT2 family glycosyltransferase